MKFYHQPVRVSSKLSLTQAAERHHGLKNNTVINALLKVYIMHLQPPIEAGDLLALMIMRYNQDRWMTLALESEKKEKKKKKRIEASRSSHHLRGAPRPSKAKLRHHKNNSCPHSINTHTQHHPCSRNTILFTFRASPFEAQDHIDWIHSFDRKTNLHRTYKTNHPQ